MEFAGKTAVVTGGASGIGAALVARLDALGADTFTIDRSAEVSSPRQIVCDVSDGVALQCALAEIEATTGAIDVFVSNAGVLSEKPDALGDPDDWTRCWEINVMAHVHAARALVPGMLARGGGSIVIVASAAGLLNQIGDAPYSASKHAAVSFAESLAITHRAAGLGVSVVCPQYVATPLIGLDDAAAQADLLSADAVAECILAAVSERRFLVLPHPQVQGFAAARARDHDAWIDGMIRLRDRAIDQFGDARPEMFYKLL